MKKNADASVGHAAFEVVRVVPPRAVDVYVHEQTSVCVVRMTVWGELPAISHSVKCVLAPFCH